MIRRHAFVCTNRRPEGGRGSCAGRGSEAVLAALQRALAMRPEAAAEVAVTACACLGPCTEGPTVVVYPEAVWYAGVQVSDAGEIVDEHLVGGRPVERLVYPWPDP